MGMQDWNHSEFIGYGYPFICRMTIYSDDGIGILGTRERHATEGIHLVVHYFIILDGKIPQAGDIFGPCKKLP